MVAGQRVRGLRKQPRVPLIERACAACGNILTLNPSQARTQRSYCNATCWNQGRAPQIDGHRTCTKCGQTQPLDHFYKAAGNEYRCKVCQAAYQREWARQRKARLGFVKHRHPDRERQYRFRKRYGLTAATYAALLAAQGNMCALCRRRPPVEVDHDHATGVVRGLLCAPCNHGLGLLGDTPEALHRAITYLAGTALTPSSSTSTAAPSPIASPGEPLP